MKQNIEQYLIFGSRSSFKFKSSKRADKKTKSPQTFFLHKDRSIKAYKQRNISTTLKRGVSTHTELLKMSLQEKQKPQRNIPQKWKVSTSLGS